MMDDTRLDKELDFGSVGFLAHSLDLLKEYLSSYEESLKSMVTARVQELRSQRKIPTSISEEEEVKQVRRFFHEMVLSFLRGEYDEGFKAVKVKCVMSEDELFDTNDKVSCLDGFSYTGRLWLGSVAYVEYEETESNKALFDYIRVLGSDNLLNKIRSISVFTTYIETTSGRAAALLLLEMLFLQMEED